MSCDRPTRSLFFFAPFLLPTTRKMNIFCPRCEVYHLLPALSACLNYCAGKKRFSRINMVNI